MADFVAVLKKALDGLGETTPATRVKVYDKARATIANKLAAITPPPPAAVAERQKQALEDAIKTVEAQYAKPAAAADDPLAELESIFSSIDQNRSQSAPVKPVEKAPAPAAPVKPAEALAGAPAVSAPRPTAPEARPTAPAASPVQVRAPETKAPVPQQPVTQEPVVTPQPAAPAAKAPPVAASPVEAPRPAPVAEPAVSTPKVEPRRAEPDLDEFLGMPAAQSDPFSEPYSHHHEDDAVADHGHDDFAAQTYQDDEPRRKRGFGRLLVAAVVLLALGGGGYAAWLNRDTISGMLPKSSTQTASAPSSTSAQQKPQTTQPAKPQPSTTAPQNGQTPTQPVTQPATANGSPSGQDSGTKFTQRLQADGKETDPGPAGGESGVGEGTSVATLTQAPPPAPVTQPTQATQPGDTTAPAASPDQSVSVGQRAIFYEERTNVTQGSAQPGTVVWSLVQESPGGDLPPEPAIRAEATIPGKDLQLRMTIRRNADKTLPASHIIEMIFLTPEGFEGGGIENILRVAMKSSEQDAGNALLGIPAKIADGFFLVALNETKAETDANLTLMRRQSWIDIPVVYRSGRRALFTLEKGVPGEKVFDEALRAWQAAGQG